ncbi:hypothetical protein EOL73_00285 [Candidatus Saccharibacteria bacterium]|nr:hypothetical protein [Candidatus Saccharibacteria bacterium]
MKIENSYVCPYMLEFAKKCAGLPKGNFAEPKSLSSLGSCDSGSGHDKFLSGIDVVALVTASQSWWLQWDTYHFQQRNPVYDSISSSSKMHTILKDDVRVKCSKWTSRQSIKTLETLISTYNDVKNGHVSFEDVFAYLSESHEVKPINLHELFQCIVHSCPSGFELTAGIKTNYMQCKTVYNQRKWHKMDEWKVYCEWIESLPEFSYLAVLGGEL